MFDRIRSIREDRGFTLVELLIVIVILGILAAVVVVAVGNINQNAQTNACSTEEKNLITAEEAYFANNNEYASEATLVANGQLTEASSWYDISLGAGNASYTINTVAGEACA